MSQPVKKYNSGNIVLSVFENSGASGTYNQYQIQKFYKNPEGEYQYTNSMNKSDLPNAIIVLQRASMEEVKVKTNTPAPPPPVHTPNSEPSHGNDMPEDDLPF